MGLEGVVAKRCTGLYRPGYRGRVKVKNPAYWLRESEVEGFRNGQRANRPRVSAAASRADVLCTPQGPGAASPICLRG
jgi:hypothetical protein